MGYACRKARSLITCCNALECSHSNNLKVQGLSKLWSVSNLSTSTSVDEMPLQRFVARRFLMSIPSPSKADEYLRFWSPYCSEADISECSPGDADSSPLSLLSP